MNHKRSLMLKMLLALTLFAGLMFAMAATASAETHEHNGITYNSWESSTSLPNERGNWYLTQDVHLSNYKRGDGAAWVAPPSETHLLLNHHSIILDKKSDEQGEIPCSVMEIPVNSILVLTDDSFGIKHGTISGGDAGDGEGGGIIVYGTLNMQNGIISGNKAKKGGGVAVLGSGRCELYFCDIKNNSVPADGDGGGVYVDSTAKLHLGSDSASTPKISGNKAGDRASDVSIAGGGDWFPIEVGQDGDVGMKSSSMIGIEVRQNPVDFTTPTVITTGFKQTPLSVFYSNDPRFEIVESGTGSAREAAVKYKQYTVTFKSDGKDFATRTVYGGEKVTKPKSDPTREGSEFDEWLYNDLPYDFDTPVLEDMTLVAKFKDDHYHDGKLFSAWESNNSLPTTAGNYYLTEDVTISDTYTLNSKVDIHICLNGHTVKKEGGTIISLDGGSNSKPELSVYDCSDPSTGKLTGATSNGTVSLGKNATFTLYGGSISGNNTVGIYANGNNRESTTVIINGGAISNCAGGIYAMRANIRMNGGTIANNTWIGVELEYHSGMQISGGSIIGNTYPGGGPSGGGGVYIGYDANEFKIIGSDKITITGNTYQGAENNVFFNSNLNKKISFGDDCVMHEDSRIGVTKKFSYSEGDTYAFTSGLGEHAALANFSSDNGEYQLRKNSSGEAELYYNPYINVTFDPNGGSGQMAADTAKYNQDYELPECTFNPPAGYEKDG